MPEQQFLTGGHPAFRVRDKETKHQYTVSVVDPEAHEVLNEDAVDAAGTPIPPKHHLTAAAKRALDGDTTTTDSKGAAK